MLSDLASFNEAQDNPAAGNFGNLTTSSMNLEYKNCTTFLKITFRYVYVCVWMCVSVWVCDYVSGEFECVSVNVWVWLCVWV